MFSTIIIFIIILGILVFVHEFGHFIVAKKSGMVVQEFGFGFPPRIVGLQKVEGKWRVVGRSANQTVSSNSSLADEPTIYSINAIPLGGFVKILGENNEHQDHPGSFINKGFWARFFTLVAGVLMNLILAWALISFGYAIGLPTAISSREDIPAHANFTQPQVAILEVVKGLPADKAGVKANDIILNIDGQKFSDISEVQAYVRSHGGQNVIFEIKRGAENLKINVTPSANPPQGEGPTGVALAVIGRLQYPIPYAIWEGLKSTVLGLQTILVGFYTLIKTHAGIESLGGPVQIAKLTGQVAGMGFVYLLQFTAFLSLNLAFLNILPFPALDGGRVLFLIIEKFRGKKNNQKIEQIANAVGFVFLLMLMVVVTVHDIIRK